MKHIQIVLEDEEALALEELKEKEDLTWKDLMIRNLEDKEEL